MKVSKISTKLIKPHTPTPQNRKNYYISFLDQLQVPGSHVGVVLFYGSYSKPEEGGLELEESLARILVKFYPLAGRYIKNDHVVDCSDQGVEFVEAEALDVELMDLVARTKSADQIKDLFPDHYYITKEADSYPLLSIQVTRFPCGGVAIGISVSHRVMDVSSVETFVSIWSNGSSDEKLPTPSFDLPSLLPYNEMFNGLPEMGRNEDMVVTKRFVFKNVASTGQQSRDGKPVSRVRVVSAAIAKALISLDTAQNGKTRDFYIIQPLNMRGRTIQPHPGHACGNLSLVSFTRCVASSEAKDIGIQELVRLMGDGVRKSIAHHAGILSPDRDGREIIMNFLKSSPGVSPNTETNFISFTDWSKFGFYEADFGWGKPVWATTRLEPWVPSNTVVLMSNKEGDGIEAWVRLNQNDMPCFEQDEEIKLLAT